LNRSFCFPALDNQTILAPSHGPPGSLKQHCLILLVTGSCFVRVLRVLFCLTREPPSVTVTTAATGAAAPAVGGTVAIASVADLKECAKKTEKSCRGGRLQWGGEEEDQRRSWIE